MRHDGRGSSDRPRNTPRDDQPSFEPVPPELEQRLAQHDERLYRAHEAAAEVTGLPAAERPEYVSSHPACLTPEFVELMIAMARERRGIAPDDSVRYAHLAATAAEAAFAAGGDHVDDARALAFAELGNAHRICGDLRRAGIAFGLARERARFVADPLVSAEILSMEASYLDYRREFAQAEKVLRRAERTYEKYGSPSAVGQVRVQRGSAAQRVGNTREAIALLRSGLELIDPGQEPRLQMVGIHNLANALVDDGRPEKALTLLRQHRPLFEEAGTPIDRARLAMLEGKAAIGANLLELASASLEAVRDQFIELDMPYETAVALLDLTEVYARRERWNDVERSAAATLAVCQACGAGVEALAACQVLLAATRRKQRSAETLAILSAKVRRTLEAVDNPG